MRRQERSTSWRRVVAEQAESTLSAAAFCRERKISLLQFYQWRRRFRNQQSEGRSTGFVELLPCSQDQQSGIRLRLGEELAIEVDRGFDPLTLRAVLDAIFSGRRRPCLL
jgi:transposase-like protein